MSSKATPLILLVGIACLAIGAYSLMNKTGSMPLSTSGKVITIPFQSHTRASWDQYGPGYDGANFQQASQLWMSATGQIAYIVNVPEQPSGASTVTVRLSSELKKTFTRDNAYSSDVVLIVNGQKQNMINVVPRELVTELWNLFNQADIIIGHNGDKFDIRKSNTRFIEHGLTPPDPYKTIDTLKAARKYFSFNSNKLDDLGRRLGIGRKIKTGGFELWLGCINGDIKAWNLMKKYNRQDVLLLERVYLKLRPWIDNHPNLSILSDRIDACPTCASTHLQSRGMGITQTGSYRRFQCTNCGAWSRGPAKKVTNVA